MKKLKNVLDPLDEILIKISSFNQGAIAENEKVTKYLRFHLNLNLRPD